MARGQSMCPRSNTSGEAKAPLREGRGVCEGRGRGVCACGVGRGGGGRVSEVDKKGGGKADEEGGM